MVQEQKNRIERIIVRTSFILECLGNALRRKWNWKRYEEEEPGLQTWAYV